MNIDTVNGSGERDYRYILAEDTYVVWLAGANRFLQLKEPAFFVLEAWSRGKDTDDIALECVGRYGLPADEALRFTNEIIAETEKIYVTQCKDSESQVELRGSPRTLRGSSRLNCTVLTRRGAEEAQRTAERNPKHHPGDNETPFSSCTCLIQGKTIRFIYGNDELEELFRPMFRQFETEIKGTGQRAQGSGHGAQGTARPTERRKWNYQTKNLYQSSDRAGTDGSGRGSRAQDTTWKVIPNSFRDPYIEQQVKYEIDCKDNSNTIELFCENYKYCLKVFDQEIQQFEPNDTEHFQGAVLMEVLNILHGKTRDEWMGVFHASAVSNGEEALLFVADSGSGKSTLATLMVAHGFQLLSDDFVPVALDTPGVYPLPAAISVKEKAIPFLKDYFPSLSDEEEGTAEEADLEVFLPLPEGSFAASPVKAKAIVFVQYDPATDFRLTRESNLAAMNSLLKQSWIANNPAAAERFLAWYFSLPVYSLIYSDSETVVNEMMKLMRNE